MPVATRPRSKKKRRSLPSGSARLKAYHAKRDLRASGEPGGSAAAVPASQPRFVIQKHDATRLHYDFRLEMDGVYRSWAVPKGLPKKPGDKALAVEVEDHPLDYGNFEGTIPAGNYGAGTVMLWDHGFYSVEATTPEKAYRAGKLHVALEGEKCHGEWTLVRMKETAGRKTNWLVIKNDERGRGSPFRTEGLDLSVKTGRSMAEIAGANGNNAKTSATPNRKRNPKKPARNAASKPPPRATRAKPHYVEPMKALGVPEITGTEWWLEIKYDGFRAIGVIDEGKVELWSRNEKPLTEKFPEVADALSQLPCKSAVLDGEIVALEEDGRPSFQRLQGIGSAGSRPQILYYVFDLLHLDGRSFVDQPIEIRREALEGFLKRTPDSVRISPVFDRPPGVLLEEVKRRGLEGIVGKRRGSLYEAGQRSGSWVKRRVIQGQELVIGGYTPPGGSRHHFGALLVGYFDGKKLRYAGKVGAGFDADSLASLHERFRRLESTDSPFSERVPESRGVTWLKPKLIAQVKYSEWTRDGLLRQPVFLGLRDDKDPREVVREAAAR
ncbi:ATP-dependent DNA ligase [Opitutaceae bacterium EW11]|nr:ATP-dependent DNA ligase [Opitutaceae bacterium EW11]